MVQYLRPSSDISSGGWSPSTGAVLASVIDESSASDTDYIQASSGDTTAEVLFSSAVDPSLSTGHTFRMRAQATGSGGPEKLDVDLVQGSTVIANMLVNQTINRGSYADYSYTLLAAEADAITDYTDLRVRFIVDTLSGGETIDVSWAEIEVPDAAAGATRRIFTIT